jgi:microsomal dipeptidase-like Zn-dependent dipeptidase
MSKSSLAKRLWKEFELEAKKQHICSTEFEAFQRIPRNAVEKTLLSIGASMIGYWDSLVKDGWASLDARALKTRLSEGKIVAGFKRTWVGPAPVGSNIKIVVKKRKGTGPVKTTARGTVTAEKFDKDGGVIERKTITFAKGKYESTKEITFNGNHFGFIIVTVDTNDKILKFPYAIKYQEVVLRTETRRVRGFADIHVHQSAEHAYAGRWLHGSMMGDPAQVLKACTKKQHGGKLVNLQIKDLEKFDKAKDKTTSFRTHGNGYPGFKDWPHHLDISHQQVHENWLKQAYNKGLRLMVSSAVNSEVLSLVLGAVWDKDPYRDMDCLKLQINKIHEFCDRNKSWVAIAYNPWHAREIIHSNKLAIVLAVECSNLFPADQGNWRSQLEELYCMGVRSYQIVHHCDNRWGGAAPQERGIVGIQTFSRLTRLSLRNQRSRLRWLDDGWFSEDKPLGFDFDRNGENVRGLSNAGEQLINALMDKHALIDTAHYSRRTFDDVYNIARSRKYYPLFSSHTKFKAILSEEERNIQREFLTTDDQIIKINKTGGILGLRTAPWSNQNGCCGSSVAVQPDGKDKIGTSRNFAQQVAYAYKKNISFAFGSDFNGFTNQLGPRNKEGSKKPPTVSQLYWRKGLHHIGMLPDLVEDLKYLKTPGANLFDSSAEAFLKMWQRAWDPNRKMVNRTERSSVRRITATAKKPSGTKLVRKTMKRN